MDKKPISVGMEAFNVSKLSNDGVKVPLTLPDGTPTAEYLIVCGADSKEFRAKKAKADHRKLEAIKSKIGPEELLQVQSDIDRELVASLVKEWSFSPECTIENVVAFLQDAPQIQAQVDRFAGDRSNFFTKPPKN